MLTKKAVVSAVVLPFLSIVLSLIVEFLAWFVWRVLLSRPFEFLSVWKWFYIDTLIVCLSFEILLVAACYITFTIYAKKWDVSYKEAEKAFLKYNIIQNCPAEEGIKSWKEWTAEDYHLQMTIRGVAEAMVDRIFGNL